MTVQTTTLRADYTGNGTTTAFTVPFYFLDPTHIVVYRTQISTGVITTLALTTDYTVTGAGVGTGGTATMTVAPTTDQQISILRNVPQTQLTHYVPNDPFPSASHENALDQLTMEVQQMQEQLNRTAQLPVNNTSNINALATGILAIANDLTNINAVANDLTNINADAGAVSNINTVATNISNVGTVASNVTAINTAASNITAIQNASTNATNAANSATAAASSATSASSSATSASSSASSASTSASNASTSATNAAASATAAATSAASVGFTATSTTTFQNKTLDATNSATLKDSNLTVVNAADTTKKVVTNLANLTTGNTRTLTIQDQNLTVAGIDVNQTYTKSQRGAVSALTYGATITPDFSASNNFSATLTGNTTLANPTNLTAGQSGVITITQDATGGRTMAFGSYWKFANGTAPTLSTSASAVDDLAYYVESSTRIVAKLIGAVA